MRDAIFCKSCLEIEQLSVSVQKNNKQYSTSISGGEQTIITQPQLENINKSWECFSNGDSLIDLLNHTLPSSTRTLTINNGNSNCIEA